MDDTYSRGPLLLLSGRANRPLAQAIGAKLGTSTGAAKIHNFADGEIFVRIDRNARGRDVFIVQPTTANGDNIMELLLLIDAAKRAVGGQGVGGRPLLRLLPTGPKGPVPSGHRAKLVANLIAAAGADRVVSIDFHQHQIQGFFDIPVDHLYAAPVFTGYFLGKRLADPVVVAPDVGSAKMARGFARRLKGTFAIIDKRRPAANVSEIVNVVGDVEGRSCLVADDMIDTGGTIVQAVRALKERGAGPSTWSPPIPSSPATRRRCSRRPPSRSW